MIFLSETIGRDLASSNGRPYTVMQTTPDVEEKPVPRGLANLWENDFRFPSVLTG